jgi:oxygen-independent coproporphyrinogen III oxidase
VPQPAQQHTDVAPVRGAPSLSPLIGNYFVAAYPPFSCWTPDQAPDADVALNAPAPDAPVGIYAHIPFCERKCDYCYYLSRAGAKSDEVNAYLETVVAELALYARRPAMDGRKATYVYVGGGTPSTLNPDQIRFLLDGMKGAVAWERDAEVTFEVAPKTARRAKLEALSACGVTRISMGVQSFDDALLRMNGRIHLAADVERAYGLIREEGFDWVNLDLMVGLVGETEESWRRSVDRTMELAPDSVTIYQTEVPYNTQLYRDWKDDRLPSGLIPWEIKRERLAYAFGRLEAAGHSVASAYAAVRDPSRHLFQYQQHLWRGGDMLGLGASSFSYFGGVHYQNDARTDAYANSVRDGALPIYRARRLSRDERIVREFALQLKWGRVDAAAFRRRNHVDVRDVFAEPLRGLAAAGLLAAPTDGEDAEVALTREGLLRVDELIPRFYLPEHQEARYW